MELRKVARFTFIVSVLSAFLSLWNASKVTFSILSMYPHTAWRTVPLYVVSILTAGSLPFFYFALFRNEGKIRIPQHIRPLALAGVFALGLSIAVGAPRLYKGLRADWAALAALDWGIGGSTAATFVGSPWMIDLVNTCVSELWTLAAILLLIALFRLPTDDHLSYAPVSSLLSSATKVAVIVIGLCAVCGFLKLIASPVVYVLLRRSLAQTRLTPPSLLKVVGDANSFFVSSAGLFAAPYVVYRSLPKEVDDSPA